MLLKVKDIILNCIDRKRVLSNQEIEEIISLLVREQKLESYVENVYFSNKICFNYVLAYHSKEKFIVVLEDFLNKYRNSCEKISFSSDKDNSDSLLLNINLEILRIIFHEIEHAKQVRKANIDDDIKAKIFKAEDTACHNYDYLKNRDICKGLSNEQTRFLLAKLKNLLYVYSPCEKDAEFNSYLNILKILKDFNSDNSIVTNSFVKRFNGILLTGYDEKSDLFPTYYYLSSMGYLNDKEKSYNYSEIKDYLISNYDLLTRIKLNLPITTEEKKAITRAKIVK